MSVPRVFVTGLGAVSGAGPSALALLNACYRAQPSFTGKLDAFDPPPALFAKLSEGADPYQGLGPTLVAPYQDHLFEDVVPASVFSESREHARHVRFALFASFEALRVARLLVVTPAALQNPRAVLSSTSSALLKELDFNSHPSPRAAAKAFAAVTLPADVVATLLATPGAYTLAPSVGAERVAVEIGCGISSLTAAVDTASRTAAGRASKVSPHYVSKVLPSAAATAVSVAAGLKGGAAGGLTACAAGANSIASAFHSIRRGGADVVVCGAAEAAIQECALAGFRQSKAAATVGGGGLSLPFDAGRRGFVMGEGAGVLVLESEAHARARGADVYAELLGVGISSDAHHLTLPRPDGSTAALAMARALRSAALREIHTEASSVPRRGVPPISAFSEDLRALVGGGVERRSRGGATRVTESDVPSHSSGVPSTHPHLAAQPWTVREVVESVRDAPQRVWHVNAHAAGTPAGDVAELRALRSVLDGDAATTDTLLLQDGVVEGGGSVEVLPPEDRGRGGGSRVIVSSTKGVTGHLLGAAGAVEAIAAVGAVVSRTPPPLVEGTTVADDCATAAGGGGGRVVLSEGVPSSTAGAALLSREDIVAPLPPPHMLAHTLARYAQHIEPLRVDDGRWVLSNSFGFGGSNACLVFGPAV